MTYVRKGTRQGELLKQTSVNYIRYLMSLPGDTLVRLYSYQAQEAWDIAEQKGYWAGSQGVVEDRDFWEFRQAYAWMQEQMATRIPDYSGDLPMWGWLKRPSAKPKPTQYQGTSGIIRLTVMVPLKRILFSDYDSWHHVLNVMHLSKTEREHDEHCKIWAGKARDSEHRHTPEYLEAIRPSWQSCLAFNPATNQEELDWGGSTKRFIVQACVDRFKWDEVVAVRRFPDHKGRAT
jgi:hypothetical protein